MKFEIGVFQIILILIIVAVRLSTFFMYVAKFKQTISHIGMGLIIGGLVLRAIIELLSIYLSANINLSETVLKTNNGSWPISSFGNKIMARYYRHFSTLHFYYIYLPLNSACFQHTVMMMDLSYILIAVIFYIVY